MNTTTRNANLNDLVALLTEQHARKIDLVADQRHFTMEAGQLYVSGVDPILQDDGVLDPNGIYRPTGIFDEGVSEKLNIPLAYVRRLRRERVDLYDANVNGWLHGVRADEAEHGEEIPADHRAFMLRLMRGDDEGIARALLSDRFGVFDNLDALMATLDGIRQAGVEVQVHNCDLTERRMVLRVICPEVQMYAPTLLKGYRSPFTGASADENPTVFAGFKVSNSETGDGAYQIVPEIVVQVCTNGMTVTKEAIRQVHIGGRLDTGVVRWTADTQEKAIDLVRAKTRDAVSTFLNIEYMRSVVGRITEKAATPIDTVDSVKVLTKKLSFTQEQIDGLLDHFVRGGQMTTGGVMQAVTSYAQTVDNPDTRFDLEAKALQVIGY